MGCRDRLYLVEGFAGWGIAGDASGSRVMQCWLEDGYVLWQSQRANSLHTRRWWRGKSVFGVLQSLLSYCLLHFVVSHVYESGAL